MAKQEEARNAADAAIAFARTTTPIINAKVTLLTKRGTEAIDSLSRTHAQSSDPCIDQSGASLSSAITNSLRHLQDLGNKINGWCNIVVNTCTNLLPQQMETEADSAIDITLTGLNGDLETIRQNVQAFDSEATIILNTTLEIDAQVFLTTPTTPDLSNASASNMLPAFTGNSETLPSLAALASANDTQGARTSPHTDTAIAGDSQPTAVAPPM